MDTAYNGDITIAFGTDPSGGAATLSGTLTRTAVNGVATFDDLSVDVTGTGYTLRATSEPLAASVSNAFDVAASSVDPDLSLVVANPTSISSVDGVATVTVTAFDGLGNPVTGATVELSATGSGNTLTQPSAPTDVNGEATGTLSSTVAGTKTVSATVNGVGITRTASVTVTVGPVSAAQSTVSANPTSISTDGETSTITVTARDANGNPIQGATVVLAATGTGNTLTQPAAPTDASGDHRRGGDHPDGDRHRDDRWSERQPVDGQCEPHVDQCRRRLEHHHGDGQGCQREPDSRGDRDALSDGDGEHADAAVGADGCERAGNGDVELDGCG